MRVVVCVRVSLSLSLSLSVCVGGWGSRQHRSYHTQHPPSFNVANMRVASLSTKACPYLHGVARRRQHDGAGEDTDAGLEGMAQTDIRM